MTKNEKNRGKLSEPAASFTGLEATGILHRAAKNRPGAQPSGCAPGPKCGALFFG